MKRWYIFVVLSILMGNEIKADMSGDRTAFPIYTRALRINRPRVIVVKPLSPPPQLSELQRSQEQLAHRQLTEGEIKAAQERIALQPVRASEVVTDARLTDEELKAAYDREMLKRREAEIATYSHMYGASQYGWTDQYHR